MAINITPTTIQVGNFKFRETDTGIEFTGQANTAGFVGGSQAQGSVSGYTSGGLTSPTPRVNTIDKFSFSVDNNATDVGDLTIARQNPAGQSSSTHGYTSSGESPSIINAIDKFPFAVDANATDVGDVTQARREAAGQSSSVSGYSTGGTPGSGQTDIIDKFPFATDTNATDVGNLSAQRQAPAGQNSDTFGYTSGGYTSPGATGRRNIIDKFPFAIDTNASDVGDLTLARNAQSGQSSSTFGYNSGGYRTPPPTPGVTDTVDKFSFAVDINATDVGNLTQGRYSLAGQSSTISGYTTGGTNTAPSTDVNIIDKFPFASDNNSTDVGDLFQARLRPVGQQV